jgi:hypothetical protein
MNRMDVLAVYEAHGRAVYDPRVFEPHICAMYTLENLSEPALILKLLCQKTVILKLSFNNSKHSHGAFIFASI